MTQISGAGSIHEFGSTALIQAIARLLQEQPQPLLRFAVALSGGADSAMLAVHAARFARQTDRELHFFHVHHGLQAMADHWQGHIHDLAQLLRVSCHSRRVQVDLLKKDGIESAARDARYEALRQMARQVDVRHVLLAHHRNDQVETVLLRLLRGAGPTGLAAMAAASDRQGIVYLRPWLDADRTDILRLAQEFQEISGWTPVQDPTNADDKYTRAAVRERLVPALNERWPGWQASLVRHARQSAEIREVLHDVAAGDFARLEPSPDGQSFSLAAWRALAPARQPLVLRYWLAQLGLRMPSDARLQDAIRQLRGLHALGHDRQMRVKHGSVWICCTRGRVHLDRETSRQDPSIKKS